MVRGLSGRWDSGEVLSLEVGEEADLEVYEGVSSVVMLPESYVDGRSVLLAYFHLAVCPRSDRLRAACPDPPCH